MAKVTMKLEGMEKLQRYLVEEPAVVQLHAEQVVAASSFAVSQRAKALVPVVTGDLRRAIGSTARGTNGRVGVTAERGAHGTGPQRYWKYVEFGTSRSKAHAFFIPAAEAEIDPYVRNIMAIGAKLERDFSTSRFV